MLLVLDVGNTNTVLGVFAKSLTDSAPPPKYDKLVANWRVTTRASQTTDEYGVLFRNLFSMQGLEPKDIGGIVVSSVVPPLDSTLRRVCERYFNTKPLFIEPGVKTGMPVLYENPAEVGADRIVNSVAAFEKYGGPCVVVDFGTATTFDCVSAKGEYQGGVISPGIGISADALFANTARLPRVDIRKPARIIGSTTVGSLQSGLYFGYLGLVRNPGAAVGRTGSGNQGGCDWRLGFAHREGIEIHQASRRSPDAGRPAHYLGAQWGNEARTRGRTSKGAAGAFQRRRTHAGQTLARWQIPLPLSCSWKTTSITSRKSKNTFSGAAAAYCCFPRWIGR